MNMSNFILEVNPKLNNMSTLTSKCVQGQICDEFPSFKVFLTTPLERAFLFFSIKGLADGKSVVNKTINVCSMEKNPGLNLFVRTYFEAFKPQVNFEFKCPFTPVRYFLRNFHFSLTSFISGSLRDEKLRDSSKF